MRVEQENHKLILLKVYSIFITIFSFLILFAFVIVFHHAGYDTKLLVKMGLKEQSGEISWAVYSWNNCIQKLGYDSDIVFFGDSITCGSDFRYYFRDKRIVNLGYSGDSLSGMINRVSMIEALSPEKVFILGGINGLTDYNIEKCVKKYEILLDSIRTALPNTEIYVQSVLPISTNREVTLTNICHNASIVKFNDEIRGLAEERKVVYVDLFSLFVLDGEMNPDLTTDGVHLKPEAYGIWADAIRTYIE